MQSGGGGGGQFGVPGIQQFMVESCSPHGLFAALSTPHDNTLSNHHHHLQQQHQISQQQIQQHQQSFQSHRLQQLGLQAAAAVTEDSITESRPRDLGVLNGKPNKVFGFRESSSSSGQGLQDQVSVAHAVAQQQQNQQVLTDDDGDGERGGGGVNRWPMEETLALLRIRSQMDSNFRDSNAKGPLWENVSRKLAELGYHRSAKKCKEKFENVNKYHKKTKDGRMGRPDGKSYRFFNELEALSRSPVNGGQGGESIQMIMQAAETSNAAASAAAAMNLSSDNNTSEDEYNNQNVKTPRKKRKRKQYFSSMAVFFENLVKQLMDHQEELHRKFLEAIERREQERISREEAWRRQEMARLSRETELRAHEQALANTREAALVAFLQKITGEDVKLPNVDIQTLNHQSPSCDMQERDAMSDPSNSKRWPKPEVHALIRLRSSMEGRFQEPGIKGPLWEEISNRMACQGFHRSAKRCKEKWENINKYFRKTKDSMKKRPENAKTCPYFHQLDALYEKGLLSSKTNKVGGSHNDALMIDQAGGEDDHDHDNNDDNNDDNDNDNDNNDDDEQAQTRSDSELLAMIPAADQVAAQPPMKNNHFYEDQSQKRLKMNNISVNNNNNQASNSLGLNFELSGSFKLQQASDDALQRKASKMERLVKEMLEMQQQKFLDDFERREQEQERKQSMGNHDQQRQQQQQQQQGEVQDERSSQSALMALVHKLTVNAADYATQ